MKENTRKMLYPKNRREYTEAFVEEYAKDPLKSRMIESFGQKYYDEVMSIHRERLDKDDFMIGPQSGPEWDQFREQLKRS